MAIAAATHRLRSLLACLTASWREIEPGLSVDRDNSIERWDGAAEGRATSICFEGFGISALICIGRTPKREG